MITKNSKTNFNRGSSISPLLPLHPFISHRTCLYSIFFVKSGTTWLKLNCSCSHKYTCCYYSHTVINFLLQRTIKPNKQKNEREIREDCVTSSNMHSYAHVMSIYLYIITFNLYSIVVVVPLNSWPFDLRAQNRNGTWLGRHRRWKKWREKVQGMLLKYILMMMMAVLCRAFVYFSYCADL